MIRPLSLWLSLLLLSLVVLHPRDLLADDAAPQDQGLAQASARLWSAFSQNCIACHNAKKAEGGLNLESHALLMAGGDSGPSIVASDPDGSYLLERVISEDDPMPPEDNSVGAKRFTEEEVALLRDWIAAGAHAPEPSAMGTNAPDWQSLPPSLQPAYAMSASRDGNFLAFGRGGHAVLVNQQTPSLTQAIVLSDPKLAEMTPANSTAPPSHLDFVNALAFSPDSQRLATGGYRTVKIWQRETTPTTVLEGLNPTDGPAALSASGQWLAQAVSPHGLELTAIDRGISYRLLAAHRSPIVALAWIDDERLLSSDQAGVTLLTHASTQSVTPVEMTAGVSFTQLRTWKDNWLLAVDTNKSLHLGWLHCDTDAGCRLELQSVLAGDSVAAVAMQAGEVTHALVGLADGRLKVLALPQVQNAESPNVEVQVVAEHKLDAVPQSLAVSHDGKVLAVVPESGPARLVNLADGVLLATLDQDYSRAFELDEMQRAITRQQGLADRLAAKVPELQKLVEQEAEATKKVQEARDKAAEELQTKVTALDGVKTEVGTAETALAEAQAAVAEAMKLVETRNAELEAKRKVMAEAEQQKLAADEELAKRDQALATAKDGLSGAESKVPEMEQRVGTEKTRLSELEQQKEQLLAEPTSIATPRHVIPLPDGKQVAVSYPDHIRLFAVDNGRPLGLYTPSATVKQLLLASDGLLGLTADGQLLQWGLASAWRLERTIGGVDQTLFSDRITALGFSPDGRSLAVGSGPASRFGDIKLVDVASGEISRDFGEVHSDSVLSVAFSPDGRWLASGGADKLCRVFDVATGEQIRALEGHTHHVLAVAWRDDGQVLVTASADASLKVWDVEPAVQLRTIGGFSKEVTAVQFVGQGSEFVLAAADGTARLYNADNGQMVRQFGGASNALYAVAVSAQSEQLYSAGQTGHVYAWRLADGQLVTTVAE